jgi:NAD(P)-dependent dehydrogenase (short-subunit alcohol dehydrogenase family)
MIIAGASRGIGLSIATKFANSGHSVGILSRTNPSSSISNAVHQYCDLASGSQSIQRAFQTLAEKFSSPASMFVYSAGVIQQGLLIRSSEQ